MVRTLIAVVGLGIVAGATTFIPGELVVENEGTDHAFANTSTASPYLTMTQTSALPTTSAAVSTTDAEIDARFTGLLSHVRWLIAQQDTTRTTTSRDERDDTLVWRQIDRLSEDTNDGFGGLGDEFDTSILTVNEEATINGSLGVAGTTTLAIATVSGRLGIGTTNPLTALDVVGGLQRILRTGFNGQLLLDSVTDPNLQWNSNVIAFMRSHGSTESRTHVTTGQNLGYITFRNHTRGNGASISAITTEDHSLTRSGTRMSFTVVPNGTNNPVESLSLSDNRNVGIGTSTPLARLTVTNTSINRSFLVEDELNDLTPFIIDANGNVGIGTTSPQYKLDIWGTGRLVDYTSNPTGGTGAGLRFASIDTEGDPLELNDRIGWLSFEGTDGSGSVSVSSLIKSTATEAWNPSARGSAISFETTANGSVARAERFRIDHNGNVGIGTTTPSARLTVAGTVRFIDITGGTLQTDALGNVTVSSDERLKDITGAYEAGLEEIIGLEPITYNWNDVSGFDTETLYAGFSAQNVRDFLPAAVGENPDGFLTLSDRPILAALVNAVKEMWGDVQSLMAWRDEAAAELEYLRDRVEQLEATLNVTPPPSNPAPTSDETTQVEINTPSNPEDPINPEQSSTQIEPSEPIDEALPPLPEPELMPAI